MRNDINKIRERRKQRVRARIYGTAQRPRLSVSRSNRAICVQLIDDSAGRTLAAASSKEVSKAGDKKAQARAVGLLIAKRTKEKGIKSAVFDRGAYKYHGRIKALAEAFRESGLKL